MNTRTAFAITDPISIWHTEHIYFRRLLDLLRAEVDVFQTGDRPNYELMLDIISYLRDYSDKFHHPREDVAFERLAKHCPDMKLPLARLSQQHRVIANAGEALVGYLNAILDEAIVSRADVEVAAATYLVYYGSHIAEEEKDVLARAAQALLPEDWEAVDAAVPAGRDPLFGNGTDQEYRVLRRMIALKA